MTDGTRTIVIDPNTQTITSSTKRINVGGVGSPHTLTVSQPPALAAVCQRAPGCVLPAWPGSAAVVTPAVHALFTGAGRHL